jgi:hypothetical protein
VYHQASCTFCGQHAVAVIHSASVQVQLPGVTACQWGAVQELLLCSALLCTTAAAAAAAAAAACFGDGRAGSAWGAAAAGGTTIARSCSRGLLEGLVPGGVICWHQLLHAKHDCTRCQQAQVCPAVGGAPHHSASSLLLWPQLPSSANSASL